MASAHKSDEIVLLTSGVNIAESTPFTGRSRRMIKFGSRIDDDDDDEEILDDGTGKR